MIESCDYCASERVAAVLDKRIENSPKPGNKYRQRCLGCSRWLPCCSAADFQTAEHQHVLPADADPEGDAPTVPAEDFPGVVEGVGSEDATTVMTDGGEDEEEEEPDVNEFDCPGCGVTVEGYPDECPECGAPYRWDEE